MEKIYGYKKEDLIGLARLLVEKNNAPLKEIFREYSISSGKAVGTVRNLYYALAKLSALDKEFCDKYLNGTIVKVEKAEMFDDKSEEKLVFDILSLKNQGCSIRKAVHRLANGDSKIALRFQNKFRNICRIKPSVLESISKKLGVQNDEKVESKKNSIIDGEKISEFLTTKLKREINGLVKRISDKVESENQYLKRRIAFLEMENLRLSSMLFGNNKSQETIKYFAKGQKEFIN